MTTKKQWCEGIVESYAKENGFEGKPVPEDEVYYSTTLGIAMEHLGLLTDPEIRKYIKSRVGTISIDESDGDVTVKTAREYLASLPD